MKPTAFSLLILLTTALGLHAQKPVNDVVTPLHNMKPDYPVSYDPPKESEVRAVLDKVLTYLDGSTPAQIINRQSGAVISDPAGVDSFSIVQPGDFRLTSYEWGV